MSDEEAMAVDTTEGQRLTVEYKDGQLQIVEVTPYEHDKTKSILPDVITADSSSQGQKFMQVIDPEKGLMQLDLLNLTLVRCDDGEESYRLVTSADADGSDIPADATVTCVLQSSDGEDPDTQESYVMMEGEQGLVFLQSALTQHEEAEPPITPPQPQPQPQRSKELSKKNLSPQELLDKAKALQKAKNIFCHTRIGKRGRRRKGELPPPQEMLSSPDFKLFLYSCKLCNFKCNAIKELAAHRSLEHGHGVAKNRAPAITLQCARCPYRGGTHAQLMKHVNAIHMNENESSANKVSLDSKEVEEADVLVCGACGYESGDKGAFRKHIVEEHGATTT
ncbi:uncharacterized protein LOC113232678 [Hyposmocoma kahamanoa]|uniref:uncharacterized protein LOC113232678 n=1 Tax=Hyposmocoma kahamanoa TaxID=1477025 RepID=UPI000E6D8E5B|nr:uncharacterized protein LOC113232678 [Hyposmocoma kahamanoa]XP_026323232.1 uncharacterized protein LOC113232678 [Hyposmocoma kahamanoa]XP_026323233.1 uncharacterized protein LOC113232678 [Hyposmocoma kahamanoa]